VRRRKRDEPIEPHRVRAFVWRVPFLFLRHNAMAVPASASVSVRADSSTQKKMNCAFPNAYVLHAVESDIKMLSRDEVVVWRK
jgi:hypothetical protein